jgi:ABC-2 type transport system permease protein
VQAVVPLIILLVMSMGTSLILATLSVFFRDIEYIWGVLCMLIMYASAIFYPVERIINNGNGWVFNLNPVYMCIANFRNSVLYGVAMDMKYCLVSAGISLALLLIGVVLFYKKQDDFILYL